VRIAILLAGLGAGGAERVVARVAAHWAAQGHEVCVISFDAPDDPVFHPMPATVRLQRLAVSSGSPAAIGQRIAALRAALRAGRPDLLVSFLTKINVIALLASEGLGIPTAVAERNHPSRQGGSGVWPLLRRLTYARADLVLLQTEDSRTALPAAIARKGVVVPNPISSFPRSPEPAGPKLLAAVGRLEPQKGFDLLIDAFAPIAPHHPDWTLAIWGEGPERAALEARAARQGLGDRVRFRGLSDGPAGWIREASAFVLSSRYEGFGNAVAEAMAAGLPVVAFACEFGVRDLVTDEADGLLVPPEEVPALAAALDRMLGSRALRDRLGQAARISARRFSEGEVLRRWDEVLARLAREGPSGRGRGQLPLSG
jgi:glycosyltransferase involved in cell wall biosynthesis